ncbi:MAG TPA: hypothetical protein VKT49_08200 [Bryobacteraceae bacterium]|nr:hypothetical protein [Bryobacteraceae bacterium]
MKFCVLILLIACAMSGAQDAVLFWHPLAAGNSWTWRNDSLGGDWAHPTFKQWTMEQTIVRTSFENATACIAYAKGGR